MGVLRTARGFGGWASWEESPASARRIVLRRPARCQNRFGEGRGGRGTIEAHWDLDSARCTAARIVVIVIASRIVCIVFFRIFSVCPHHRTCIPGSGVQLSPYLMHHIVS